MPSEVLSIFPAPPPIRSCMKQPTLEDFNQPAFIANPNHRPQKSESLQGLAVQYTTNAPKTVMVQSAESQIKHSLFCDPIPIRSDSIMDCSSERNSPSPKSGRVAPFTPPSISRRTPPPPGRIGSPKSCDQAKSPASSRALSPPLTRRNDDKVGKRSTPPPPPPGRIGSPKSNDLTRSPASSQAVSPPLKQAHDSKMPISPLLEDVHETRNMHSIFPKYDHTLPLSQQAYYPTISAQAPPDQTSPRPQSSSAPRPSLRVSTVPLPDQVQSETANFSQLQVLWDAVSGLRLSQQAGKIRLAMHRETKPTVATNGDLEFGFSKFYTMTKTTVKEYKDGSHAELQVRRHHPLKDITIPIAQVNLSRPQEDSEPPFKPTEIAIFPQTAALAALEIAATSHRAASIAQYDPRASSIQAAQLAFDAVAASKKAEQCQLVCTPESNQYGGPENKYELQHPRLGDFKVSVTGQVDLFDDKTRTKRMSRGSRHQKIRLHRPCSATMKTGRLPCTIAAFDATSGILEIDVAAMKEFDSPYLIDTSVCAILTIALMESEASAREVKIKPTAFSGPPQGASNASKKAHRESIPSFKKLRSSLKCGRRMNTEKPLPLPPQTNSSDSGYKLPTITRGLLKVLGFSLETIVWLLGLGVKVLTKLVIAIAKSARKD